MLSVLALFAAYILFISNRNKALLFELLHLNLYIFNVQL